MSSKKTLYDLLEISPQASQDAVRAAFDRLTQKFDNRTLVSDSGLDTAIHFNLVKDAFFTLGNPERRKAYDALLTNQKALQSVVTSELYGSSGYFGTGIKLFLVIVALAGAGYYYKTQKDAEVERQRIVSEQQKEADAEALEKRKETEQLEADNQRKALEAQQSSEFESARAEADHNARDLQYSSERAKREEAIRRQQQDSQRQREYADALRRVQRDEATASLLDAQNSYRNRSIGIKNPATTTATQSLQNDRDSSHR